MKKKIVILVLCMCLAAGGFPSGAREGESSPGPAQLLNNSVILYIGRDTAYVNGQAKSLDPNNPAVIPFEEKGRTFVPMRFLGEALGADVRWDPKTSAAILTMGDIEASVKEGQTQILVNNTPVNTDASAMIKEGRMYLPLRAVSQALSKEVFYYEGMVIVSDYSFISDETAQALLTGSFMVSEEPRRLRYTFDQLRFMMGSGERASLEKLKTVADCEAEISSYMELTEEQMAKRIDEQEDMYANEAVRPEHQKVAAVMGLLYERTGNEEYARRIIIILQRSALAHGGGVPRSLDLSKAASKLLVMPLFSMFAYHQIADSPSWEQMSQETGMDLKVLVKGWVLRLANSLLEQLPISTEYYYVGERAASASEYYDAGNLDPYYYKHLAGCAIIFDEPELVRDVVALIDNALKPRQWFADGMWYESSFAYGQQMIGNIIEALRVLNAYIDPPGYQDTRFGLTFDGENPELDLLKIFPVNEILQMNRPLRYPDGRVVPLGDTQWGDPYTKSPDDAIGAQYLENTVWNHLGLYAMKHGNTRDAQQATLNVPSIINVSHSHYSLLSLTLWSGGMELLPDGGYVKPAAGGMPHNRYIHTSAFVHNLAMIDGSSPPGSKYGIYYIRPNILAYDDGARNGKQVQLLEASTLLHKDSNVDMNRRLIAMIATDTNHSYTIDIQRLKGGMVHERFLRQVEEEDVSFSTDLNITQSTEQTLQEHLSRVEGLSGGEVLNNYYAKALVQPQTARTSDAFSFRWTGENSGTTLNVFIKGNENSLVAFSQFPTCRRVIDRTLDKDKFPGYHYYQRQDVTPDDITLFGAVYEGYRKNEEARVKSVTWEKPEDNCPMVAMLKVDLGNALDYIYISNDTKERRFGDYTFSGNFAAVRVEKETGKILWSYLNSEGRILGPRIDMKGEREQRYEVIDTVGSFMGTDNRIKVKGVPVGNLKGVWANVSFSDGSGATYKIQDIDQSVLYVHNDPGFKITDKGAEFTAFPMYEEKETGKVSFHFSMAFSEGMEIRTTPGKVWLTLKTPSFVKGEVKICQNRK